MRQLLAFDFMGSLEAVLIIHARARLKYHLND
jgi:hypothetical protein